MISFLEPGTLLKMNFFWGIFEEFCLKFSEDIFYRTPSKKLVHGLFKIIQTTSKPGPGPWKTWTQKNLDIEKPGPWKIWTLKILNYEKRGKQLDAEKKIRRPHGIIY